jgi:hypothetical protein
MGRYRKGSQKLNGIVPLKEMFGYATHLAAYQAAGQTIRWNSQLRSSHAIYNRKF